MLLKKKRIRSLKHLSFLEKGKKIYLSVDLSHVDRKRIDELELEKIVDNELFLPSIVGPVSRYNAEGKKEKLKNLPKETYYVERLWTWNQRIGGGKTEEHSKIVYIPHKRYQVKDILPVGVELRKINSRVYGPALIIGKDDEKILHTINLFLELFGECEILSEDLEPLIETKGSARCNWEFIKPGDFQDFKAKVLKLVEKKSKEQKYIILRRVDVVEKLGLSCVGVGVLGFKGYVAFQSKNKKYTIFENIYYGNAIYVTDEDRKDFSKHDKQTILKDGNYAARIIHDKGWEYRLKSFIY